ncbi:N-formylglutamate amidohydrolase [Sphingomonas sp. ID0503]|uniref:N-formylglutamate amidohydrolase n=1 Tax=Sphingomonas sp. ID0503 TaxID=3399691 RepID=UPI003AFA6AFE
MSALLGAGDPPPVMIENPAGRSPFLFIGDHAGDSIPAALGTLGLSPADRARHIALDIGVRELGGLLAARMDAVFIRQCYSRLVIDCNRNPLSSEAVPHVSDGTPIPGNMGAHRKQRCAEIHQPYQQAISSLIQQRSDAGRVTVLISLHSFTPLMDGFARPWHVGILHHQGDVRYALALLASFRDKSGLVVGENEPYRMDGTDYTVPLHAYASMIPYAEIEIRQDLLATSLGIERVADWLLPALSDARRQ